MLNGYIVLINGKLSRVYPMKHIRVLKYPELKIIQDEITLNETQYVIVGVKSKEKSNSNQYYFRKNQLPK
jgi:hypothetical protein